MTPMKKLQDHFTRLNEFLLPIASKLELNKTEPKYNRNNFDSSVYTKGVESDFIRIYQDTKTDKLSFAFAFNNFNPDISKTEITVSIKNDKKFEAVHMNFDAFKDKLKGYLSILEVLNKTNSLNFESCVQALKSVFVFSQEYSAPDYRTMVSELIKNLTPTLEEVQDLKKAGSLVTSDLLAESKAINDKVVAYKAKLENTPKVKKLKERAKTIETDLGLAQNSLLTKVEAILKGDLAKSSNVRRKEFKTHILNELKASRNKKFLDQETINKIEKILEKI